MREYNQQNSLTNYNGITFKSKLESLWAKTFDLLGIKYEYEPFQFKLDNKDLYTPDFELINFFTNKSLFVEIKPRVEYIDFKKYEKFIYGKQGNANRSLLVLCNYPVHSNNPFKSYLYDTIHRGIEEDLIFRNCGVPKECEDAYYYFYPKVSAKRNMINKIREERHYPSNQYKELQYFANAYIYYNNIEIKGGKFDYENILDKEKYWEDLQNKFLKFPSFVRGEL